MDYGLGLWLEHEKRRGGHPGRVLALAVVLNLLLLGFFKYANFLIGTVNGVTGAGLPLLEVSLPIGISFYTFQALSYIIDLYRGEVEVQRSILNFGTYVSLFPQLIAGPIVRMKTVAGELQDRQETFPDFAAGVRRFTVGLAKKVLLANTAGEIWQTVSGLETGKLPVLTAWIGLAAFTFQIYFDFSGYSDMAIARPDVWFPLPGKLPLSLHRHQHHGFLAALAYHPEHLVQGICLYPPGREPEGPGQANPQHPDRLAADRHLARRRLEFCGVGPLFRRDPDDGKIGLLRLLEKAPVFLRHLYTMLLVMLSWAIFAFDSLGQGVQFIGALFGGGGRLWDGQGVYLLYSSAVLLVLLILGSTGLPRKAAALAGGKIRAHPAVFTAVELGLILAGFVLCVAFLVDASYNPFLYFRF